MHFRAVVCSFCLFLNKLCTIKKYFVGYASYVSAEIYRFGFCKPLIF